MVTIACDYGKSTVYTTIEEVTVDTIRTVHTYIIHTYCTWAEAAVGQCVFEMLKCFVLIAGKLSPTIIAIYKYST